MTKTRVVRWCTVAAVIAFTWFWLNRTTGQLTPSAAASTGAFVLACAAFGRRSARASSSILNLQPGVAFELTIGFLLGNTLLFLLTLLSPLGFAVHSALLLTAAMISALWRTGGAHAAEDDLIHEVHSLACVLFVGVAASLWVGDQQPLLKTDGNLAIFNVWPDVFIHAREVSAFAQSHGFATLSDVKLAGVRAAAYHFASYMFPAALNALTSTSALDAYGAFQLPFGILLMGMAAYSLVSVVFRKTWPAVIGSAAVVALPDTYQQGFDIRFLSFHFMSQVNPGMLYGCACMAIAWSYMIDSCRRERWTGVVVAFVLLATCATYKAHLFVANALILMLYPCAFFGRFRIRWRIVAAVSLTLLFVTVVMISQWFPRVPTLRVDGSGLRPYVQILFSGFGDGRFKDLVRTWYLVPHGHVVNAILVVSLIFVGSFGIWLLIAPLAWWRARAMLAPRIVSFVLLIVLNYMAMSTLLAMDDRGIGSREEFVNRPHAWVYFVVVAFGAAALATVPQGRDLRWTRARSATVAVCAGLALLSVFHFSRNLQTFPEWSDHATYAQSNSADPCFVRAARYIHDHARADDLMQDSDFDPRLVGTAIAERQSYVIKSPFGGNDDVMAARMREVGAMQTSADPSALRTWAATHHVQWYLTRAGRATAANGLSTDVAYRCGAYDLYRFDGDAGSSVLGAFNVPARR